MSAPNYVSVEVARKLGGLRIAFGQAIPGPWSVAARVILDMKGIDYISVPHIAGGTNEALHRWSGQNSAPVAMLDDERPRAQWSEILLMAERLAPHPALIPQDARNRALLFGISHEIVGEDGLGWNARLLIFAAQAAAGQDAYSSLVSKYSAGMPLSHSKRRLNAIIEMLAKCLEEQASCESVYFLGQTLTAVDIYWMAFSNLLNPMNEHLCVMPGFYKELGAMVSASLDAPLPRILLEHRDRVAQEYGILPIEF